MAWKCALYRLPLGGAKGGVACNVRELSAGELERLSRGFIREIAYFIGPERDIPAPDVGTNGQVMAWMMDEYARITGKNDLSAFTGKPISVGGSEGRSDATTRGGWYVVSEAAKDLNIDLKGATVAIQGFGNVGANAALLAGPQCGCKVIAVSDSTGGVLNRNGLDLQSLKAHKDKTGSVIGSGTGTNITGGDLLELDVDILIPAALENAITVANDGQIKAKLIAEFANGPVSFESDGHLFARGIPILPDFLCNAGGVIVSHLEMVQNRMMDHWENDIVSARQKALMTSTYASVANFARMNTISLRRAAYTIAVTRVAEAMRARGWV